MRVTRALSLPLTAAITALALAGCMQTGNQVAMAPRSDLDAMAYGQPSYYSPSPVASADSGGAISALRASFEASPRGTYAPVENAYAAAPVSARHDAPYHLDAGDKLPAGLAAEIAAKLRNGYIREPSVAVEVETYRPFFILGEVAAPGQYPYVPNMSVESAVAIAGGFSPRAKRDSVTLTHNADRVVVPLGTPISPGDTVLVSERWF